MWIHEGWATYLESLYVESRWGKADALKYLNGLKPKVKNLRPIISAAASTARRRKISTSRARSFSIRCAAWSMTTRAGGPAARLLPALQVSEHHDRGRGAVLQPANRHEPDADLQSSTCATRHCRVLEFAVEPGKRALPLAGGRTGIRDAGARGQQGPWQIIHPTTAWQTMQTPLAKDQFNVATDLYYVTVLWMP